MINFTKNLSIMLLSWTYCSMKTKCKKIYEIRIMKISVIIPVYNGEQTIVSLNNALFSYFGKSNYLFE